MESGSRGEARETLSGLISKSTISVNGCRYSVLESTEASIFVSEDNMAIFSLSLGMGDIVKANIAIDNRAGDDHVTVEFVNEWNSGTQLWCEWLYNSDDYRLDSCNIAIKKAIVMYQIG